jgi:hypothetical protein
MSCESRSAARPGGFYRLRIAAKTLPQQELAKLVSQIAQEKVR